MHSAGAHVVGVTTVADIEPEEGAVEVMRVLLTRAARDLGAGQPD
jgi:hypothetical protein